MSFGLARSDRLLVVTARQDYHRSHGLRPITDDEIPLLEAVGGELRRLREGAGLSRPQLAAASGRSKWTVYGIEHAEQRTRLTTLRALALGITAGDEAAAEAIAISLADLAGPTLAPSNRFSDRREGHQARREARADRLAAAALPVAEKIAEAMVDETLTGYRLYPLSKRDRSPRGEMVIRRPRWQRKGMR
ncbi:MAG TPA: helix-turn-helix transcriptional regulator [Acidimicrobiales bacterium]|jgi:transcriptional regulator with XRE-family HTH domain|nr:helix-turn-helix transcriptional regulator [Acidimicrobiales bacterium]